MKRKDSLRTRGCVVAQIKKNNPTTGTAVCARARCMWWKAYVLQAWDFLGIPGLGFPSTLPEGSQGLVDLKTENTLCSLVGL